MTFTDLRQNPKVVVKKKFPLLSLNWYIGIFIVVSANRYVPTGSNGNALCITTIGFRDFQSWHYWYFCVTQKGNRCQPNKF